MTLTKLTLRKHPPASRQQDWPPLSALEELTNVEIGISIRTGACDDLRCELQGNWIYSRSLHGYFMDPQQEGSLR